MLEAMLAGDLELALTLGQGLLAEGVDLDLPPPKLAGMACPA